MHAHRRTRPGLLALVCVDSPTLFSFSPLERAYPSGGFSRAHSRMKASPLKRANGGSVAPSRTPRLKPPWGSLRERGLIHDRTPRPCLRSGCFIDLGDLCGRILFFSCSPGRDRLECANSSRAVEKNGRAGMREMVGRMHRMRYRPARPGPAKSAVASAKAGSLLADDFSNSVSTPGPRCAPRAARTQPAVSRGSGPSPRGAPGQINTDGPLRMTNDQ